MTDQWIVDVRDRGPSIGEPVFQIKYVGPFDNRPDAQAYIDALPEPLTGYVCALEPQEVA